MFVPSGPELRVARGPRHVRVMKHPDHRRVWQYEAVDHHPDQTVSASEPLTGTDRIPRSDCHPLGRLELCARSVPVAVHVGQDLKDLLERDRQLESSMLPPLQQGVTLCLEQGDTGTPELLEHLIVESEEHLEWLEAQLHLITAVGLENYAAQQIQPEA